MKNKMIPKTNRIYIICICLLCILFLVSGCDRDNDDSDITGENPQREMNVFAYEGAQFVEYDRSQFIYTQESMQINLPDGLVNAHSFKYFDGRIYFASSMDIEQDGLYKRDDRIGAIDINDPSSIVFLESNQESSINEDVNVHYIINAMHVDNDGHIWIADLQSSFRFDILENENGESDEMHSFVDLGSISTLRMLDAAALEMLQTEITNLDSEMSMVFLSSLITDNMGNVYINNEIATWKHG